MEWGVKTIVNTTSQPLFVTLVNRKGSTPGVTNKVVSDVVEAGQTKTITFGDDLNPFLDALELMNSDEGGRLKASYEVQARGKGVDNALNTNDTVTVTQDNISLVVSFSNS